MIETIPSGTVLHGRYRIERVLGSGGFGHVYLAVDTETNQQSAVKEYLVTGTSGQEQLKHEARVLGQLHHPNIPAFLDAFMERGRYYVVLNYIDGQDLTDLIRTTRQHNEVIPIAQILQWMLAICDAVMFLHNQHPIVIHRDIKPDNIRITPNGTAVLVDLGNAKAVADGARTLFFIRHQGTPGYAPPEQYPGGTGTDARSDVYALGGTLYFALTGHEPTSVSARNQLIQQRQPDLPSLRERLMNNPPATSQEGNELRQFRLGVTKPGKPAPRYSKHLAQLGTLPPELLQQLNQVIQRAMAMKPRDRYQFVIDFANDLKRILMSLPPSPQTPDSPHTPSPYATEPNLQERFEAIQTAREQTNQGSVSAGQAATGTVQHCPRCNAPLTAQAAFCPRCGTPLGPNRQGQPANKSMSAQNVAAEPTLQVDYRAQKQANSQAQAAGPDYQNTHTARRQPGQQQAALYPQRQAATMTQAPQTSQNMANNQIPGTVKNTTQVPDGNQHILSSSINVKVVAVLTVIVIILIIIAIVLAVQGHHGLGLISPDQHHVTRPLTIKKSVLAPHFR